MCIETRVEGLLLFNVIYFLSFILYYTYYYNYIPTALLQLCREPELHSNTTYFFFFFYVIGMNFLLLYYLIRSLKIKYILYMFAQVDYNSILLR